ncbi:hypothetical protein CALVIDRAFT_541292 [Calocera viscosa TUFC12733]|uniref:Uncharacterized protein n=1 Tax=Calocera viscosa (strain TUFC12733) TaxID=1330018 RepID=A0A167HXX9_CALVF|nr:hypothetical protein CALVIDRAFT_541292 [Calocera viscosa TUFC12733]
MLCLRSFNFVTLTLLLLLAVLPVLASPTPAQDLDALTNAERFRRGLPPKAPRRLYEASVADTARKARRS